MNRQQTLETALKAVTARPVGYDLPEQNFDRIARRWKVHFFNRYGVDVKVDAADVAIMCADLKIARLEFNISHEDSWVDLAGYAACGSEVATAKVLDAAVVDEGYLPMNVGAWPIPRLAVGDILRRSDGVNVPIVEIESENYRGSYPYRVNWPEIGDWPSAEEITHYKRTAPDITTIG